MEYATLLIQFIQHIWQLGFPLDSVKGNYGRGQEGKQIQSEQGAVRRVEGEQCGLEKSENETMSTLTSL